MPDYGVSIRNTGPQVIRFQIRVVSEDGLRSFPLSKQTENEFDGDAHAPNDGFTTKNLGVHCYASKKSFADHGFGLLSLYVLANSLFARTGGRKSKQISFSSSLSLNFPPVSEMSYLMR